MGRMGCIVLDVCFSVLLLKNKFLNNKLKGKRQWEYFCVCGGCCFFWCWKAAFLPPKGPWALDRQIQSLVNSGKQERRGGRGCVGTHFNSAVSNQSTQLSDWRGETQAAKETGPWFVQGHQQWFETILFADTSFMLLGCQFSDFVRFMAQSWSTCMCAVMSSGQGDGCYWKDSDPCLPWLSSAAFCLDIVHFLLHVAIHMLQEELKQKVKQQVVKGCS